MKFGKTQASIVGAWGIDIRNKRILVTENPN